MVKPGTRPRIASKGFVILSLFICVSVIFSTDIESFTILKDASETAQYGSRGASGVIEVTTKKGMSGRTQVAYNGSFGISTVYKNLKMLSGDEFRRVASERGISILDKGNNTDFQKEIEQTGLQQNHHIAFYGGSSESSYRVSLGFWIVRE